LHVFDRSLPSLYAVLARRPSILACEHGGAAMSDILYIGLAVAFFVVSWGFVKLCDRV
jgi:hypothetical protein